VKITHDPIVAEVRRQRDKLAAKFGYDLAAIVSDIQTRQCANPRLVKRRTKRAARIG
jgi:hypothetical protein